VRALEVAAAGVSEPATVAPGGRHEPNIDQKYKLKADETFYAIIYPGIVSIDQSITWAVPAFGNKPA
jgi:hypothetical protein